MLRLLGWRRERKQVSGASRAQHLGETSLMERQAHDEHRAPRREEAVSPASGPEPGGRGAATWVRAGTGAACWAEDLADPPGTGAQPPAGGPPAPTGTVLPLRSPGT